MSVGCLQQNPTTQQNPTANVIRPQWPTADVSTAKATLSRAAKVNTSSGSSKAMFCRTEAVLVLPAEEVGLLNDVVQRQLTLLSSETLSEQADHQKRATTPETREQSQTTLSRQDVVTIMW